MKRYIGGLNNMKSTTMTEFSGGGGASNKTVLQGFTLAEVLITLGVIGIVAAMTLPALITRKIML